MKCERCGAILQDDAVSCMYCGQILQRVPDYNPLEDVIKDEIRLSINQEGSELVESRDYVNRDGRIPNGRMGREGRYTERLNLREGRQTERLNPREQAKKEAQEKEEAAQAAKAAKEAKALEMRKRREIERRRAVKRKQRRILIGAMCAAVVLIIIAVVMIYNNSYNGKISKGITAMSNGNYDSAVEYLEKALDKDDSQSELYLLLAESYNELNKYDKTVYILMSGISKNSDEVKLYEALIECYLLQGDTDAVKEYMDSLKKEEILEALSEYISEEPTFSLSSGTYDDVQELILTNEEGTIYYTTDGTTPTMDSEAYSGGIQLSEGTTIVKAININTEGISSDEVIQVYTVEFPMESAPIVTPSTGQYTTETYIVVTVPTGYTAYYTMDNTTPDTESSVYTGPIEMPEGNTIFTVVLVSASGKYSDITKRNYDLSLPKVDEEDE